MKRAVLILAATLAPSAANAAVDVIQVPAMCGGPSDVFDALAVRMPNPEMVGKGGNSQGTQTATLFTGNGYWALLATTSKNEVCVVASGFNWTAAESPKSF